MSINSMQLTALCAAANAERWAGSSLVSVLPVVRTALQVSNRDDYDVGWCEVVDNLIGEPAQHDPTGQSHAAYDRADLGLLCDQRHRVEDRVVEFPTETAPTFLVPADGRLKLFRGRPKAVELARHRPRISFSIRRLTSSQGSSRAVPDSIATTRRSISAAHAASASGSAGPSRLASISAASSARASTSSRKASARTASAGLVMAVILARLTPPNKRVNLSVDPPSIK